MSRRVRRAPALAILVILGVVGGASTPAKQARTNTGSQDIPLSVILSIEDDRAAVHADVDVLLRATRGQNAVPAIRALGRLERRDVLTDLLHKLTRHEDLTAEEAAYIVEDCGARTLITSAGLKTERAAASASEAFSESV